MTGESIKVVVVPYHYGVPLVSLGRGPGPVAEASAAALGEGIDRTDLELPEALRDEHELARCLALEQELREVVAGARAASQTTLVLAGNDHLACGAVAGLDREDPIGVVWIDGHADANTPEVTPSGYFDGLTVARLRGLAYAELTGTLAGFRPVAAPDIKLFGIRELDPGERALLRSEDISFLAPSPDFRELAADALDELAGRVGRVYVHLDADAIDADTVAVSRYSGRGGLSTEQLDGLLADIRDRFEIAAMSVVGYDPAFDRDGIAPGLLAGLIRAALLRTG